MNSPSSLQQRALAAIPAPAPQYRKPPLTLGRLYYLIYHAPKAALQKGPRKIVRGWFGKRRLAQALPEIKFPTPSKPSDEKPISIHVLSGARYLAEACLLTHSLAHAANRPVAPSLYDDGTLTADDCNLLRDKLPNATLLLRAEIEQRLAESLPESRFPCLRRLRPTYPHIRKLTDIHLFPGNWKLVSDADILFFTSPNELLEHLSAPRACHMVDIAPAYGVPQASLEALAGRSVHPKINVGLCHLPSQQLDWEFIEYCAVTLLATHGFSYYLEQALSAIILARLDAAPLNPTDYVVYPNLAVARQATVPAMHYVDDSRAYYYDFAWKQMLARSGAKR